MALVVVASETLLVVEDDIFSYEWVEGLDDNLLVNRLNMAFSPWGAVMMRLWSSLLYGGEKTKCG